MVTTAVATMAATAATARRTCSWRSRREKPRTTSATRITLPEGYLEVRARPAQAPPPVPPAALAETGRWHRWRPGSRP